MSEDRHEAERSRGEEAPADLIALHATGALTPAEEGLFEDRLSRAREPELADVRAACDALLTLADGLAPIEPPPRLRETVLAFARAHAARPTRARVPWETWEDDGSKTELVVMGRTDGDWEETGVPGVRVRRLFVDRARNRMTALFKMDPGSSYVPHVHAAAEECFVVEGDLHVGDLVLGPGDYQMAPPRSSHGVQWTEHGCVLYISSALSDERF